MLPLSVAVNVFTKVQGSMTTYTAIEMLPIQESLTQSLLEETSTSAADSYTVTAQQETALNVDQDPLERNEDYESLIPEICYSSSGTRTFTSITYPYGDSSEPPPTHASQSDK